MEFRVLGPLEVRRDGVAVALPGGKPRLLLARLLVDAGRVVSTDALADALWGEAPPATLAATLQVYVSNLRKALGATAIVTRPPGYALEVAGHEFDHVQLEANVARARTLRADGDASTALRAARDAVALVAGEPYAEVAFEDWTEAEVLRLRGLVLAAHEELHASLLDLGRHGEALPMLESLVAANPFHERLRAQLMLALYRDGRQTEALRCYAEGRRLLVEELGVEPGPELRQMEARVLEHDELLRPPTPVVPAGASPAGGTTDTPDADDGLVGRERPRRALRAAWDAARSGRLQVVVLDGEPGTGKTALARHVASVAAATGGVVGFGTAHELAGAPPFWPWTSALRDVDARGGHDQLAGALRDAAGGELVRAVLDDAGAVDAPQFSVFDAFARVLDRLGRDVPVLLVLDDAHWADQASLDLVQFVARAQLRGCVMVLIACRPLASDDRVSAVVASIVAEPSVRRLTVGALDAGEVHRLVERHAGGSVDVAIAHAIADRTGGNPWLVEELVRQLVVDDGELDVSQASVPDTVRALTRARAARLGAHAVDVLTIASFVAGEFDGSVAQRLLGLGAPDVVAVLDDAARAGLVVDAPGRPGWYRFTNSLVRHAFYDSVPPLRRAETHVSIGRGLVDALGSRADRRASEIAVHFSQGIDAGGAVEAVHWLRRAAAQAARSNAYEDATRHLRRALFVTRSRLDDARVECEVLIELARAARLAADPATAQLATDRAHRLAVRLGDDALAVRATSPVLSPGPHWLKRAP